MQEIWKKIKGYKNYEVSNLGRIRSLPRPMTSSGGMPRRNIKILKQSGQRYNKISLNKNGRKITPNVHVLVAKYFIPNLHKKPCINHIDGNTRNNTVLNLEWCTSKENCKDSLKRFPRHGEYNIKAKLNRFQVQRIRLIYKIFPHIKYEILSHLFGISKAMIGLIINKKNWKHI